MTAWDARTVYPAGSVVDHGGASYFAATANIDVEPPAAPWVAVATGGGGIPTSGPTIDLPLNGHRVTGAADPVSAQDYTTKAYVDALSQGFDLKASVRAASNTNHALTAPGATVDGVALTAGDRVLLRAQTTAAENGIWTWNGPTTPMTRAADANTSAKVTSGLYTFAVEGTTWAGTGFALITADPIVLGTTALTFTPVTGAGEVINGTGLTKTGNTLAADFGTTAGKVTQGNDGRLSDPRTPTAHAATHAAGAVDVLTPDAIGASATGHPHVATAVSVSSAGLVIITHDDVQQALQDLDLVVRKRARVLDEVHADAGAANLATEQALATLVLPAGAVAAGDLVRFIAIGDFLNNSGAAVTYQFRFKIGTTTVLDTTAVSINANATRRKFFIEADIMFPTTATEEVGATIIGTGTATASWSTGTPSIQGVGYGTAAEDTATAKNVILTCQLGTAALLADVILHAASLVLVKK